MKYDFDKVVDRHGTNCLKYDFAIERGKPADILPLWVADMDFQTAPAILERLEETVKHGIFGYSDGKEGYFAAVQNWYRERFGWETKPEWLVKTPGVVFALAAAVRAYTKEGDGVLLQQPVYYPFSEVITDNGRKIVNSPLKITDGYYTMDLDALETKIVENKVKLFLLAVRTTRSDVSGARKNCAGLARFACVTVCSWSAMRSTVILPARDIRTQYLRSWVQSLSRTA